MKRLISLFAFICAVAFGQNPVLRDYSCTDTGAANVIACDLPVAPANYAAIQGKPVRILVNTTNTGAVTANLNSLGAIPVKKMAGAITTALVANDLRAGQYLAVIYDGTNFQMHSQLGNVASGIGVQVATSAIAGTTANLNATTPALPGTAVAGGIMAIPQKDSGSPTTNLSFYIPAGNVQRPATVRKSFQFGCSVGAGATRSVGIVDAFNVQGSGGACSTADSTHPVQYWSLASGTAASALSGGSGDVTWRRNGNHIHMESYVMLSSVTTNPMRYAFGMTNQSATTQTGADTVNSADYAVMFFHYTGTETNWSCASNNNNSTAPSASSTSVAITTGMNVLTMDMDDTTPQIVFAMNGTTVCTLTTALPTATTFMRFVSSVNNLSSGATITTRHGAFEIDGGSN